MNDTRRTILWVVFSFSLFLIWDAWNKHTGQPSVFSPPAATKATPAATRAEPAASALPPVTSQPSAASLPTVPTVAAATSSERVEVITDPASTF